MSRPEKFYALAIMAEKADNAKNAILARAWLCDIRTNMEMMLKELNQELGEHFPYTAVDDVFTKGSL